MALTGAQEVSLAAIIYETPETVATLVTDLDADVETHILARMAVFAPAKDSHVKLKGGKDGVDFDNERKRAAIRAELRIILGLDPVSALDPMFDQMQLIELEVGSNFG